MTSERTKARLKRYPRHWKQIVALIRIRSGDECECSGQCGLDHAGRCRAPNGDVIFRKKVQPEIWRSVNGGDLCESDPEYRGVVIILTTAHICPPEAGHDESCGDAEHLLHCCQLCHLRIDRFLHAKHAAETRELKRRAGTMALEFGGGE